MRIKGQDIRMTPLLYVISQGEKQIGNIQWFLSHGSSLNEKDSKGCTPLIYAIKLNSMKLVSFIISEPGLDHAKQYDQDRRTPIHYVITPLEMGSFENIEILNLLAKEFDVNAKDSMNKDPMFYALNQDSGKMVNALVALGVHKRMKELPRSGTSIIATIDWIEEEVNIEEDAQKFIEQCIENEKKEKKEELKEEKIQPDANVQANGIVEVVYDDILGPYDLLMTKVDVKSGFYSENVFYKMQVRFCLFDFIYFFMIIFNYFAFF